MRPVKKTAIHQSANFAELVCSNSLRSNDIYNAVGLLKNELRSLDSLIMRFADENALPSGSALAVDREGFSSAITAYLKNHPLVEVVNQEYLKIGDEPTIIASGPLTSDDLSKEIAELLEEEQLYFYDAVAPIVTLESVDLSIAYYKSRYDKGSPDYLNCPLTSEEFSIFYRELVQAKCHESHPFEEFFLGCLPIEELAKKGEKTLLFGPMKPVGLEKDGKRPYAVVQLRRDNYADSLYNLVGFQTQLTWPEQKRVFGLIPGLKDCEIVRYGVIHRNTFINSPLCLDRNYRYKDRNLFFAGQITGVEGYVESTASGLSAGLNMALMTENKDMLELNNRTMIGALANYISQADSRNFQPMNANYGIMALADNVKKSERKTAYYQQSQREIEKIKARL